MCAAKEIRESRRENNILKESLTNLVHLTSFKNLKDNTPPPTHATTITTDKLQLKRKDNILERKLKRKKGKYSVVETDVLETIRKLDPDDDDGKTRSKRRADDAKMMPLKKTETLDDIHAAGCTRISCSDDEKPSASTATTTKSIVSPSSVEDDSVENIKYDAVLVGSSCTTPSLGVVGVRSIQCRLCKPGDMSDIIEENIGDDGLLTRL